jgi:hypothetical protein
MRIGNKLNCLPAGMSGPREASGGGSWPDRKAAINGVLVQLCGFIENLLQGADDLPA